MTIQSFSIERVAMVRKPALAGAAGLAVSLALLSTAGKSMRPLHAGLAFLSRNSSVPTLAPVAALLIAVLVVLTITTAVASSRLAASRAHTRDVDGSRVQAETLRQSDELKAAIFSSLSHDLKTPLATIKASISNLLDESVVWSGADRRSFLESISDETDRLNRTISALLDINRLESGAVRPTLRSAALDQLVEEAIEQASGALRARSVRVAVAPISVRTDGSLIRHAIANLLENAALYSRPEGEIRILAAVAGAEVEVSVEDDGPGIDREDLPFVFNRFYRARGAHAVSGGSGLGLAIVKGFVTACAGSVEVESSSAGTRFIIRLPCSQAALA